MPEQSVSATPNEIKFDVPGKPPLKNEALSVFNPKHGQADRIRTLLQTVQRTLQASGFAPVATDSVALEVTARSPGGDATNILGGIADVLEDKPIRAHRSSIDHLGDLATVWLYRDDKQIKEIYYREEPGASSYTVTVRTIRD